MRAIIRVILEETTDEKVIKIKQDIQKLLEKEPGVEVEVTMMG